MIVKFDHISKKAKLSLRAHNILPTLQIKEKEDPKYILVRLSMISELKPM